MDWIERWLHMSPDGGSGLTEALFTVAVAAGVGLLSVALRRGRWRLRGRRGEEHK